MKKGYHVYIYITAALLVSSFFTGILQAQSPVITKEQLITAKEKYDYANWEAETGKVIPGLDISSAILPQLEGMSNIWQKDNFSIETVEETTYAKIRQWWAAGDRRLGITMVICPTFGAAKEYLINYYANTQMATVVPRPTGRQLGLDIGNVCYAAPVRQGRGFLAVDFIRHNVLIMMRVEGNSRKDLAAAARILDGLLAKKKTVGHYPELNEIPAITNFSCKKAKIKKGEKVLLDLEVNNPTGCELYYSWDISGGGVKKNLKGDLVYYGGEAGTHTISLTVINDLGLYHSRLLEIEVVN